MTKPEDATLVVPDASRLACVEKFCLGDPPYADPEISQEEFLNALAECVEWHILNCPPYKKFVESKKFDVSVFKVEKDFAALPFLPANFFKEFEIRSVSANEVYLHLTSSGTTGQKSQMFFDAWSIRSAQRMVDSIVSYYGWVSDTPSNYLLYSYEPLRDFKLGTSYTDNFLCKYAPVNNLFYGLRRVSDEKHEFDAFGCIETLLRYHEEGLPLRIFGFPAFLYFTLKRMQDLKVPRLKFDRTSWVFLGGGWKGYANSAISKEELYGMVNHQLGIPLSQIRDGFGSVEHCIPYIECAQHRFHVPRWSRVLIRDVKSLSVLPYGNPGFLQFISPYITSVPAHSVLMGDYATLHKNCGCGLPTPWFEIHGRAGLSKNKSCAMAASELLARLS